MRTSDETRNFERARKAAWLVLLVGSIAATFGYFTDSQTFFAAYLVAFMLCLGFTLGPYALWLLHNLVGGRWGEGMRAVMQTSTRLIPLCTILFIPILFNLETLYPWAREEVVHANKHIHHKIWYLNEVDFIIRGATFFVIWLIGAYFLTSFSRLHPGKFLRTGSGLAILLYFFAISFAAFDWVMSLEPLFYSTIFGLIIVAGHLGSSFMLAIWMAALLPSENPGVGHRWNADISHDIGNFLLMSVMFWAYVSFSQLILIWSPQLPEEIMFYNYRFYGGWEWIGVILIFAHFLIPFFYLLIRKNKRRLRSLLWISGLLLASRWLDLVWLVQPNFTPADIMISWQMVVLPLAMGALWFSLFLMLLKKRLIHA